MHYFEKDKTRRAIMLSGAWGTGKSYYIQNSLRPYLENSGIKCIVVSLYGLKNLSELNKAIYLEIRAKAFAQKSESLSASKLIGKTIVKGIASFFNVDLSISETDLQQLYASIDLSGKLIIFEDLERSSIDIFDILGFVNSLVEQDGVKVMLVANEDEILEYKKEKISVPDGGGKEQPTMETKDVLTEKSERYLREKEKTVGDTIHFSGDIKGAIANIMTSYENSTFKSLLSAVNELGRPEIIDEIHKNIMLYEGIECENLRSFIYACQKTVDIFDSVNNELDSNFAKYIFMSVVAFSMRKSKNSELGWSGDADKSMALGTKQYPLLYYCYLNIKAQISNPKIFLNIEKQWIAQKKLDEQEEKNNSSLGVIYNYSEQKETDVINAIKNIKELLQTQSIHPSQYGKLAAYLIRLKYILDCAEEVDECKKLILDNIRQTTDENAMSDFTMYLNIALSTDAASEIKSFCEEALNVANNKARGLFDFDYSIEHVDEFCKQVYEQRNSFVNIRAFARKIDNEKLSKLLLQCSAAQISDIRGLYLAVYGFSNIDEFFMDDKDALLDLKDRLYKLNNLSNGFDRIQLLQLKFFIENLKDILAKLHA